MKRIVVTAPGYETLRSKLTQHTAEQRRIVERISAARTAREDPTHLERHQAQNATKIAWLEQILRRAEVIDVARLSGDTIGFGATVTVIDKASGQTDSWQIMGELEADPSAGRISILSPIARDLIGKTKGRLVDCTTPRGITSLEVMDVRYV